MRNGIKRAVILLLIPAALLVLLLWISPWTAEKRETAGDPSGPLSPYQARPKEGEIPLPEFVTEEDLASYMFAVNRPDVLRFLPCYCGCGLTLGHKNNLDCYIKGLKADGTIVFTDHATYCDICIEITEDARRLSAAGVPLKKIRAHVERAHSEKGPGTPTPSPPDS